MGSCGPALAALSTRRPVSAVLSARRSPAPSWASRKPASRCLSSRSAPSPRPRDGRGAAGRI